MILDTDDAEVISAYIRAEQPQYTGPIFIWLERLSQLHMRSAETHVHYALMFASGQWTSQGKAKGAAS